MLKKYAQKDDHGQFQLVTFFRRNLALTRTMEQCGKTGHLATDEEYDGVWGRTGWCARLRGRINTTDFIILEEVLEYSLELFDFHGKFQKTATELVKNMN
jgi:hypothetical protein